MRPAWATGAFWVDVADRSVRTAAQAALGAGVGAAATLGAIEWPLVASAAGVAAVACVLMSLATPARTAPEAAPRRALED